ncbi:MAG: NAD(P)H-dependent oxidoreductase [Thermoplasmatota archaeon]
MKFGLFYYSKTGNTKKIASMMEERIKEHKMNIDLVEIQPLKHPSFIKGGYSAIRGKELPITNTELNMKPYDVLIIGSPLWAGKPSPFIKSFLNNITNAKGKKIAFFFTCDSEPDRSHTLAMKEVLERWAEEKECVMVKKLLMVQMKKGKILAGEKKINGFIVEMFTK